MAPERVVTRHLSDQFSDLRGHLRTPDATRLRFPFPVEPKALAMPGDDSFGFDDDQDIAPPAPEFGQDYPEEPISPAQFGSMDSPVEYGEPITSPIRTATISSYSLLPQRNGRVKPRCAACGQSRCNRGNDQKERRHACESNRIGRFDADKHAGHCACETESRNHADCDAYRAEAQSVSDYKFEDASGRRAEGHPDADLRRPLAHDV